MRGSSRLVRMCTAMLVVVAPASAGAFDVVGTWVGSLVCKDLFEGSKITFKRNPSTLEISQSGARVFVRRDGVIFIGAAYNDAQKPEKGRMAVNVCGTDDVPAANGDDYDEMGNLAVTTKALKGTGKIKGASVFAESNEVGTCKWSYKRTDTSDPSVPGCP